MVTAWIIGLGTARWRTHRAGRAVGRVLRASPRWRAAGRAHLPRRRGSPPAGGGEPARRRRRHALVHRETGCGVATESLPLGKGAVAAALADAELAAEDVGLFAVAVVHQVRDPRPRHPGGGRPRDGPRRPAAGDRAHGLLCGGTRSAPSPTSPPLATAPRCCWPLSCRRCTSSRRPTTSARWCRTRCSATRRWRSSSPRSVGPGLEVVEVAAVTDPATADHMSWDVTDQGFRMGLSPRVPDVLGRHVRPMVERLLQATGSASATSTRGPCTPVAPAFWTRSRIISGCPRTHWRRRPARSWPRTGTARRPPCPW